MGTETGGRGKSELNALPEVITPVTSQDMPQTPKTKQRCHSPGRGRPRASDKRLTVAIRLSGTERADAQRMANLYAGGSLSRWARFALLHCMPTPAQAEALAVTA